MGDHHSNVARLAIGDATRLFGMTARALRYYEERGLVQAQRDHLYCRYYDPPARARLEWISMLRKAGVPLPDIQAVLQPPAGMLRRRALGALLARRATLEAELEAVERLVAELGAARHRDEEAAPKS